MTEIVSLPQPAVKARFAWLLPMLFAAGCGLAAIWPGHAGKLFCIGAIVGIWACLFVDVGPEPVSWLLPTLTGGLPIVAFLGILLDRLQTDVRLFGVVLAIATAAAGYVLLQGFVDIEHAVDHHGSLLPFVVCALQIGIQVATLVALIAGAGRSARHRSDA
ncbi:MAG: hypothetical protein JNK78_10130 [Planctomycetes bacterium]|nr:hypothetical protein [Planctomycetota bacterium]